MSRVEGFDWTFQPRTSGPWTYALMVAVVDLLVGAQTGSWLAVTAVDAAAMVLFALPKVVAAHREQGRDAASADENGRVREAARVLERRAS